MSQEITGKTVEQELFGRSERLGRTPEYLKYRQAMDLVRKLQPGDPKDPKSDFAYEVFVTVEKLLAIKGEDKLSFYTAIDSLLDHMHGVDGWFELADGRRVTVDLTTNPNKATGKADIIFLVPLDGLDRTTDVTQFNAYAQELAQQVAQHIS